MSALWSYLLAAVGVLGLYLAGQQDRRGWYIGLTAQLLWIAYATATRQWGFYVSAVAYGWVYTRNARRGRRSRDWAHTIRHRQRFAWLWLPGWLIDPRHRCPHERQRGIYGDEIIAAGFNRSRCLDCGRLLRDLPPPWMGMTA